MARRLKIDRQSSIQYKIMGSFMAIFFVTTIIVELLLVLLLRNNYYAYVESYIRSQVKYSQDIYQSYLSDYRLEDAILEDRDQFYRSENMQVQILDNSGRVLLDNIGTNQVGQVIKTKDVEEAKGSTPSSSIYLPSYDDYKVMAYSAPLYNRSEQVGIIRYIVSLELIDQIIYKNIIVYVLVGLLLLLIMLIVCKKVANSIVRPINELTELAEDLADGSFDSKAEIHSNDEIGQLADTLNFMIDSVNEKDQLKNEFISSISHELRTPLTSIKGWALTLLDNQEDPLVRDGLSIIDEETDRLQSMVEELLDFSRYTNNKVKLEYSTVNIIDLVKNMSKQMTPRIRNNDLDMVLNYNEDVLMAKIDVNKIKQVLLNIIDNAIKFTDPDGVIIINIKDNGDDFTIEVIDTGIGIGKDEINLITEKFYKGQHSQSHMGLGLSISEEIVNLHGGNMIITSVLGEGTTISIVLPKGDVDEN